MRHAAIAFGRELERRLPGQVTTNWWKEERGERIFVDYNQNARDRTIASAYSVRPKPGAPVSAPLAWEELEQALPEDFTVATMPARFAEVGDRHAAIDEVAHSLEPLLEMYERDLAEGRGDMPYPPDYPKMPGEPTRVQPSRAASDERPTAPIPTAQAPARALAQGAAERRGLRLRGQARRVSLPGVRGRRGGLPAVAQRQAARALLPRAGASRPGATCSTARSSFAARTAARTSTRLASASTRPPRGSSAWPCETPAVYVAFDLLAHEDRSLLELPFAERRAALESCSPARRFARAPVELMETSRGPPRALSDG